MGALDPGRAMRVLFVTYHYPPGFVGGAERQAQLQAEALVRRGHEVTVGCPGQEGASGGVLNGVRVGSGSIIGAGAVVREGLHVPPNSLVLGVPGRIVRETTMQERDRIARTVENYVRMQEQYRTELGTE